MTFKVEGLREAVQNLVDEIASTEGLTVEGLMAGGLIILAEAQRRVPVEYGNLRASGFVQKSPNDPNSVDIGFTASYAMAVHENLEQKLKGQPRPSGIGVYWGPEGQPKFLETAARDKSSEVLREIARRSKK